LRLGQNYAHFPVVLYIDTANVIRPGTEWLMVGTFRNWRPYSLQVPFWETARRCRVLRHGVRHDLHLTRFRDPKRHTSGTVIRPDETLPTTSGREDISAEQSPNLVGALCVTRPSAFLANVTFARRVELVLMQVLNDNVAYSVRSVGKAQLSRKGRTR
jgi:hypothetical protein